MRVVTIEESDDRGRRVAAEEALRVLGRGPACLPFDIDALDPAFAPETGAPEGGGLAMREAQRLLRALAPLDLVGAGVVESRTLDEHIKSLKYIDNFEEFCLRRRPGRRKARGRISE